MQSFRERSGFHGNQQCYQQETHELSRLETYRHHHSQTRQGYEAHTLAAAAAAAAAAGAKDCYNQQAYPGYSGGSASAEKQYKGTKIPGQHLQSSAGYGNHVGAAYSAQYISEGHLQQKWEDTSHLPQYEQDMVGRLEAAAGGGGAGGQYLEQNLVPISQSQCSHPSQPNPPVYTTHHQPKLPQDTSPSPMTYSQGPLHFPQHSQSLSSSTPSYPAVEKCNQTPHCYKGYAMPPSSQYNRQLGSSSSIKPSSYRPQSNYTYQQAPSRASYEQQPPLQAMPNTQDGLSKYQHFSQPPQNYCLTDISVRSPEQYYQNCSPSSSHSPARSVGRSPSYSSTPSPLMVNPETFQYNQQPITTGASSSSGLREQSLLLPPHSHSSSSLNPQTTSYAGSLKDRFSEKLLSNPSLWSLNALTSQVENISNNVQQLLLSEAMVANKKSSKRNPKKAEDFKGQLRVLEDGSCTEAQLITPGPEVFSTPQSVHTEIQEGEYSSSSEDQLERSYYYCTQNRSPAQATTNSQHTLETVSSCSVTSPDDMSTKSDDSIHSLPNAESGENLTTLLKSIGEEKSPKGVLVPSPLKPEKNSPADIQCLKDSLKENFEETAWPEKTGEDKKELKEQLVMDQDDVAEVCVAEQEEWPEDGKYPSLFHKISKALIGKGYPSDMEEKIYQELQNQYVPDEQGDGEKPSSPSDFNCKTDGGSDVESEMYKSEFPTDSNASGKNAPFSWSDDLVQDQYLTMKEHDSEFPHFNSRSELFEEKLSVADKEKQAPFEELHAVLSSQAIKVRKEKESVLSSEEVMNNKIWTQESGEFSSLGEEQGSKSPAATEREETELQDTVFASSERRSVICDISPSKHPTKITFSALNEEVTPLSQPRDHIDRHDAAVLEPDTPQLPGKSILHSAPSWADTPPSPKKGDEEVDPGSDCPTKPETPSPAADLSPFNRKHAEEKRSQEGRLMYTSVRIRRLSSLVGEGVPATPQENSMASSKSMALPDQMGMPHKDLSSLTPKLYAENFPSRMCTRSFTALAAPKACIHLKRQVTPKFPKGVSTKDTLGQPKGPLSKIKWKKQKGPKLAIVGHFKGRRTLIDASQQDENQDTTLLLSPPVKDSKPMVLRSRKPTQEKLLKEKGKEKRTPCMLPKKLKDMKKQKAAFLKEQALVSPEQNIVGSHRKVVYRIKTSTNKSDEKVLPPIKRKSSCHSSVPVKKQRGVKAGKLEAMQPPLKNKLGGVKSPKKKMGRGEHFKVSLSSFLTKETPLASISTSPCVPPQYPAKTKYLPPRKGRGLKYEALVQKITSPGSKKHALSLQVESVPGEPTTGITPLGLENKEPTEAAEIKPGEEAVSLSVTSVQDPGPIKAPTPRRKKAVAAEASIPPDLALEAGTHEVNTPRLAKQRAIKNNHEMHLKQRRKKRKAPGLAPPDSTPPTEQPSPALPPPGGDPQNSTPGTAEPSTGKRGKRKLAHPRKRQVKLPEKPSSKKQKTVKKTGPTKRSRKHLNAVKTSKNGRRLKNRHRKQSSPLVEEKQPEIRLKYISYKPQKNENRPFFSPYVHIDSSKEFASLCTIVNRPEEEFLLLQARKKSSAKIKNPVAVAKAIPNSSVMLQGPLVNKNLIDRCLTCCLCGKPANYRELGDLCGPYYPEDSIPRKTLSFKCKLESREDRVRMNCSTAQPNTTKQEGDKSPGVSSHCGNAPGRPRRTERVTGEHGMVRPKFRERYKKLHQFQGYDRKPGEGESELLKLKEGAGAALQRLELEAEAKEHWVHEACAVWTNGVFLVSGKLFGLHEAALSANEMSCLKCQDLGASVSCCSKGCPQKFHYVCAKEMGCLLQEENFSLKCPKHKAM
ncbi:retinoic acid-induced protein 1 [Amia ocellicauda]|uniref:retinoic acid-induced protein 1 n=1 Tax=Amia ocellicauda TaxID=2972642 RepID=UPI003464832D